MNETKLTAKNLREVADSMSRVSLYLDGADAGDAWAREFGRAAAAQACRQKADEIEAAERKCEEGWYPRFTAMRFERDQALADLARSREEVERLNDIICGIELDIEHASKYVQDAFAKANQRHKALSPDPEKK